MEQLPDSRATGSFPSTSKSRQDKVPQRPETASLNTQGQLIFPSTSTRTPVIVPPDQKKQPASRPKPLMFPLLKKFRKFHQLDRRITWYIVSSAGILTVALGFIFTIPLSNNQRNAVPAMQSTTSLITNGNKSSQILGQGQGPGQPQTQFTPGYPDSSTGSIRLFKNTSPWNMPISANVQFDPASSSMASELSNGYHVPTMFNYGMPIYTSTANDPLYTVQDSGKDSAFDAYQPIHIPDTAAPSPKEDHWMFIYDQTKNLLFEMWNTSRSGNTWNTHAGDVYSPTGDGVLQVDGSLQGGNGASYFGGVITDVDIARGYIDHALSLASQYTSSSFRYPMSRSDGGHGDIPTGARIQLDPSVDCDTLPGASVGEKMICRALETYGGYLRDTAGSGVALSMYFEGEDLNDASRNPPAGSPGNPGRSGGVFGKLGLYDQQSMGDIPWNRLRVLKSWNSFTALSTTHPAAPLLSIQTPGRLNLLPTLSAAFLDRPQIQLAPPAATAHARYWLENKQYIRRSLSTKLLFSLRESGAQYEIKCCTSVKHPYAP